MDKSHLSEQAINLFGSISPNLTGYIALRIRKKVVFKISFNEYQITNIIGSAIVER